MRTSLWALAIVLLTSSGAVGGPTIDDLHRADLRVVGTEIAYWGLAGDSWKPADDKAAHLGLGYLIGAMTAEIAGSDSEARQWGNLAWNGVFWLAWEAKDGFGGWERSPLLGDGFSYWDWAYSVAGAGLAMIVR